MQKQNDGEIIIMRKEKLPPLELAEDELVNVENISMNFALHERKYTTLKERLISILRFKKNPIQEINVLNDISFKIKKGESLGVIGHNGAGKSTLLRIVAGIYKPTKGRLVTKGRIALLNLGAGFDPEGTGEENIYLNGAFLGYHKKQMKERFDSIVEFAELGKFMQMPLKNYSSGMISRLGFAVAIDTCPDLLLVDEVLSVGDENFKNKCMEKIKELKATGVSFLFVSHNINQVREICERTLWIENSKVVGYGPTEEITEKYLEFCAKTPNKK